MEMNEEAESKEEPAVEDEQTGFQTYYPSLTWEGLKLLEDENVKTDNGIRSFMTYGGKKNLSSFSNQQSARKIKWSVSVEGDPVDLGFTVAALTDKSISWEHDGISFFIASDMLTKEEMIEVASSMAAGEMK